MRALSVGRGAWSASDCACLDGVTRLRMRAVEEDQYASSGGPKGLEGVWGEGGGGGDTHTTTQHHTNLELGNSYRAALLYTA